MVCRPDGRLPCQTFSVHLRRLVLNLLKRTVAAPGCDCVSVRGQKTASSLNHLCKANLGCRFIDENGGGPGVRLREHQQQKKRK